MMYSEGTRVRYCTAAARSIHHGVKPSELKTGVIEEAFHTADMRPCYWIENEKELILGSQILGVLR